MKLPTKDTPAGTPCWVRDNDSQEWLKCKFLCDTRLMPFRWRMDDNSRWFQCRLDDPYAKPVPHVHHDKIVQWAADPSQKVWERVPGWSTWAYNTMPAWSPQCEYHIGEEPPKPEPRMITIEGHTFAAPSSVATETHTCGLADALWIRQQDVAAYLAAKDALMALAIKEQTE